MPTRTVKAHISSQGDTGTASTVRAVVLDDGEKAKSAFLRVRVCNANGMANSTNATIAATGGCSIVETHTSDKDVTIKAAAGDAATGTLTISGVVVDAQTVTIGPRVYEFDASTASGITSGNVRVDISASATKSQGTLTMDTQPTIGDTVTVGTRTYSWVASGTADNDGEISRGADLAAAKVNFVAAINGTDDVNTANSLVTAAAFSSDDCVLTAIIGGAGGDAIVTTETFTAGTNVFDAGTLGTTTAGVSCSAANAATALRTAINADASAVVSASGSSGTVSLTADVVGTGANSYATTETMTNGSFAAATLSGGTDTAPGVIQIAVTDATAETVWLRFGPPLVGAPPCDYSEVSTSTPSLSYVAVTHAAP